MAPLAVGIIGLGDMGKMYARCIASAGWRVNACDRPEMYDSLKEEYTGKDNIQIYRNGHLVSRISDFIIYSVEAKVIDQVVAEFAPSTKQDAIVGGQTSCKAPEISAFEKHLPSDTSIISCHSLHGPTVDPTNQPLAIIPHRCKPSALRSVKEVLSCLHSTIVELSAEEHDRITADTQAATHVAFLSMGSAWRANEQFPWELPHNTGGLENVKINIMMRIYSSKWHVYAGLAILNPAARIQIGQYAQSVTELFKLMLEERKLEFRTRIKTAGEAVFGQQAREKRALLLEYDVLERFRLTGEGRFEPRPNNHLSLLGIVDCWWKLRISPYQHMIASTPLFRLWLGATEALFRNPDLLDRAIETALEDKSFRSDDLEFVLAARDWSECISFGDFETYKDRFERVRKWFEEGGRFEEAKRVGAEMVRVVEENQKRSRI